MGLAGIVEHKCLLDRANFLRSRAWQIVLIFNAVFMLQIPLIRRLLLNQRLHQNGGEGKHQVCCAWLKNGMLTNLQFDGLVQTCDISIAGTLQMSILYHQSVDGHASVKNLDNLPCPRTVKSGSVL